MTSSDDVREHAVTTYIDPARRRGDKTVQIRAGDVHKALGFHQRSALVCGALGSLKFQEEAGVKLVSRHGPGVGMSTLFTFEV